MKNTSLKINTSLRLHGRNQSYTLQLANAALEIRIIAQSSLEETSRWHLVQPTAQSRANCKVNLGCPGPYPVKSLRMQIHSLSAQLVPVLNPSHCEEFILLYFAL